MPIIKSIYWEQTNREELVYKFPFSSITTGSILTVNESQEAFFFKSGVLCDSFTAGRHILSSANLPLLHKIIELPSGGGTTFSAEVWFINKLDKRNMLWGTGGLRIIDPYFQIPIKLSARGQYGFHISDGGVFLKKLIGTIGIASTELMENQFRSDVIESVKVSIAQFMKNNDININEISTEYKSLGRAIFQNLQLIFDEYGVELLNFNIEDISFDESDKGYQTVMEAIAERAKLNTLGVSYLQQKQIDIAQTAAGNEGAGTFMGIGMGMNTGNQIGRIVTEAIQNVNSAQTSSSPVLSLPSFYVARNEQATGPYTLDILREMIMKKEVENSTYVYRVSGNKWTLAIEEPELAKLLSLIPPPPPPMSM